MTREILHADALEWCRDHPGLGAVVTSIPDPDNMLTSDGTPPDDPWAFFRDCVRAAMTAAADDAPVVFRQTDRRSDGTISKARLVMETATAGDRRLLWHKIALQQEPGTTNLRRPTYAHVLAFAREGVGPGTRWPDVWDAGSRLYANGMGLETAERVVTFAADYDQTIVDPFCGMGTVPLMADALGHRGIGVDLDREMVDHARKVRLKGTGAVRAGGA